MQSASSNRCGTMSSVHLDAIRGAAALVVLLGHMRDLFFSPLTAAFSASAAMATANTIHPVAHRVTIGNEAVIVFFVLSGYLVGGSAIRDIRGRRWSWKRYLIQRSTRLWVVLLPALLLGVAIDHLGMQMFSRPHSIYSCPPGQTLVPCNLEQRMSPRVVAANVFFLQTVLVDTAGTNNALWSLANEFWYYLAFPMCLLALEPAESKSRRMLYTVSLMILGAFVGKHICLLFLVWLLGALMCVLPLKLPGRVAPAALYIVSALFPVSAVLVRQARLPLYPAQWAVALSFSGLLYVLLHSTGPSTQGVYKTVAGFFSRMSYSLYLVHVPVAVFLCACVNSPWQPWDKSPLHLTAFLLLNVVLVTVAYLFYRAFEANTDLIRRAILDPQSRPLMAARGISEVVETHATSRV